MKYLSVLLCLVCFSNASANESPQALQDSFMAALKANDAEAMSENYTEDAVSFAVTSMVGYGRDFVKADWGGFFAAYKVIDAELADGHLEVHGDTAIAWGLFKIVAEPIDGGETAVLEGRYMDVARNIDGSWLYVADHASIPPPPPAEE